MFLLLLEDLPASESRDMLVRLYTQYKDRLVNYALGLVKDHDLAEDAVHNAFLTLLSRPYLLKYERAEQNKAYVFVIVRNLCYNQLRGRVREERAWEEADILTAEATPLDREVALKELFAVAAQIIEDLPEACRDAVFLKYVAGYSNKEISELTGVSYAAVRQRVSRGLRQVRQELGVKEASLHD